MVPKRGAGDGVTLSKDVEQAMFSFPQVPLLLIAVLEDVSLYS